MSEEREILIGLTGIATRFRVSKSTVRAWYARGAPIIRLGERSYRAVFDDVVAWLKRESIR
uniref:Putative excisionase n=1 Tax=Siphoviridae sp. ct8Hx23 TaxID=2825360 RepID=A0A8S5P940_9CAUD|nr:MAG TPA: putative excisionase [Siphoviridae sp. ct8Hx23]